MEEKEVPTASNAASSPSKKAYILGVVNASEIKCKVDRKRRWDQPPSESESGGPPLAKLSCGSTGDDDSFEDRPLENNISHTSDLLNSDILDDIPLPPGVDASPSDRLSDPPSPSNSSQTLVIKEQIVVQTPSEMLNSLEINSSFPLSSSFNELNYTEGNQRVTIEIETVEVTPSSCDDEPKTSVQIVDPNSATVDSVSNKENVSVVKIEEAKFYEECRIETVPSSEDSEAGDTMDRASIDVDSAGNVDPAVIEVILGISPSKSVTESLQEDVSSPFESDLTSEVNKSQPDEEVYSIQVEEKENLISKGVPRTMDSSVEEKSKPENKTVSHSETNKSKAMCVKLKGLVDYDDYSDDSSQQSDKISPVEPVKNPNEIATACENSVDSKEEEEFHDCFEQQITDDSNYDSVSLNNLPVSSVQGSDDLINNNPLETNDVNYDEIEDSSVLKSQLKVAFEADITSKPGLSTRSASELIPVHILNENEVGTTSASGKPIKNVLSELPAHGSIYENNMSDFHETSDMVNILDGNAKALEDPQRCNNDVTDITSKNIKLAGVNSEDIQINSKFSDTSALSVSQRDFGKSHRLENVKKEGKKKRKVEETTETLANNILENKTVAEGELYESDAGEQASHFPETTSKIQDAAITSVIGRTSDTEETVEKENRRMSIEDSISFVKEQDNIESGDVERREGTDGSSASGVDSHKEIQESLLSSSSDLERTEENITSSTTQKKRVDDAAVKSRMTADLKLKEDSMEVVCGDVKSEEETKESLIGDGKKMIKIEGLAFSDDVKRREGGVNMSVLEEKHEIKANESILMGQLLRKKKTDKSSVNNVKILEEVKECLASGDLESIDKSKDIFLSSGSLEGEKVKESLFVSLVHDIGGKIETENSVLKEGVSTLLDSDSLRTKAGEIEDSLFNSSSNLTSESMYKSEENKEPVGTGSADRKEQTGERSPFVTDISDSIDFVTDDKRTNKNPGGSNSSDNLENVYEAEKSTVTNQLKTCFDEAMDVDASTANETVESEPQVDSIMLKKMEKSEVVEEEILPLPPSDNTAGVISKKMVISTSSADRDGLLDNSVPDSCESTKVDDVGTTDMMNESDIPKIISSEDNKLKCSDQELNLEYQKSPETEKLPASETLVTEEASLQVTSENSVHSSVDLNMECESVDTEQSVESIISQSGSVIETTKEGPQSELINSNSVIDISSDSLSSDKKGKSCLNFNLSSINSKANERDNVVENKICTVISSDDEDASSLDYLSTPKASVVGSNGDKSEAKSNPVLLKENKKDGDSNSVLSFIDVEPDVVVVPDSDSSCSSKSESNSEMRLPKKVSISTSRQIKTVGTTPIKIDKVNEKAIGPSEIKLSPTSEGSDLEPSSKMIKNSDVRLTSRSKGSSSDTQSTSADRNTDRPTNVMRSSESMEVSVTSQEVIKVGEEAMEDVDDESDTQDKSIAPRLEPITLRIFKDNHSLHSESRESPKRPRLDDSPKQLEFTLKISKDANTNIPKATMSPKRTQSPQRIVDPLPRISSEVSITPVLVTAVQTDKKATKRAAVRHGKSAANDNSTLDSSVSIVTKTVSGHADVRVPNVGSILNNIPNVKTDLNNYNSVNISDLGETSIIEIKDEPPTEVPVNSSFRGGRRGMRDGMQTPMLKRRGRPRKTIAVMPPALIPGEEGFDTMTPGNTTLDFISSTTSPDTPSGRPVRECRDRTKPIVVRQRKPRGAGNITLRGRGGGRGGARVPQIPGRESLSAREQEELAKIEARKEQMRLEKLVKREAKLAKKAKKVEVVSSPEPKELTEEEMAEMEAKKEAEMKAAAEAAAASALEAERLAQEAAAAKEAEKLAKVMARRERLRELHRMKREKILAKKAAKKLKDEERRKRKAAEKAAEQAAALQSMYEDETRMSAPDGSLRPLYVGDDTPNRNKTGRMEINLSESKEVSVEQLAEYQWEGSELYMVQEQVAEYLGVKSFKRKYPDLRRRPVDAEERKYLEETGLVPKSLCDLGITAVSSSEVLDIMFQDFPDKYEEVRKYLREKQMREISSKQKALSLYSKQSDKAKSDLREQAVECAASWNAHLNRERREERKCSMDLQSFIVHYPLTKREAMKQPTVPPGNFPVAVLPGQFCDYYKQYTSNELMYYPMNTVLYGPLKPNERLVLQSDASQSDSDDSSSSDDSSGSSSDDSGDSDSEGDDDTRCKVCNSCRSRGSGGQQPPSNKPEIFIPCSKCKLLSHPSCCKITSNMLPHVRKYNWLCSSCKMCVNCNSSENQDKMRLCDLCDRGFHIACLDARVLVPDGNRWHCATCSFCWSCGAREPGGPSFQWLHEFNIDDSGEKVYQRSLCASCCRDATSAATTSTPASSSSSSSSSSGFIQRGLPGLSGIAGGSTPIRGYQLIQTKDGNQVRVAVSSRGVGQLLVRSPGVIAPRTGTPETLVIRSPRGTETLVVRTPNVMLARPRQNIVIAPNSRIDVVGHLAVNLNGATNNVKK